jgi:PQQ-like domain
MRWFKHSMTFLAATLVLSGVFAATATGPASAVKDANGWSNQSLHVVGGPIISDNVAVVLNVTAGHQLEITGIDPSDGSVIWSRPFSASQVTPGVTLSPVAIGNTVLGLSAADGSKNPEVTVEGLDAATGETIWTVPQPLVLSDAPAVCASGQYFCFPAFVSTTTTALVALAPANGSVVGAVQGPLRDMGVAPSGSPNGSDLWETNASAPTFLQTSTTGQMAWTHTVASLFGGSQFNPNYGWDFVVDGQLDIGSVGIAPVGKSQSLGSFKTVGVSTSTGSVAWSVPGYFLCGGGLQFLTADLVCRYTGTAHIEAQRETMAGIHLALKGVNPASGATTWTEGVRDAQALSIGTNVAFSDGTHVVVRLLSGKTVVLDVQNGSVTAPLRGESFWCEQVPTFKVEAASPALADGKRVSEPVFRPCSAAGKPVENLPATSPSSVGVTGGGMFIWPTPDGLQGARLSTPV